MNEPESILRRKMKKGQVSIFILIVLVIILASVFISYIKISSTEKIEAEVGGRVSEAGFAEPFKNYVESCLKSVSENSIGVIGIQGGYYEHPEYYLQDRYFFYPYYFYNNRNIMPSKSLIEKEISKAISKGLPYCVNDFLVFRKQGFTIEDGSINAMTVMTDRSVLIDVVYPINIKNEKQSILISNFRARVPVRLGTIYKIAENITNQQVEDSEHLCLSCIMDIGEENNLNFRFTSYENNETLFVITDNESILKNEPYDFMFMANYETE